MLDTNQLTIEESLTKALEGVPLTPGEIKVLSATIYLSEYKTMLEVFTGFLGNDEDFQNDLENFLKNSLSKLSSVQKAALDKVVIENQKKTLSRLLVKLARSLPQEQGKTLRENLRKM